MIEHIKIGRSLENNLIIDEEGVSSEHAELFKDEENRVFLTDMNSKNGTFLNGKRITDSIILKRGDKVLLVNKYELEWENLLFDFSEVDSSFKWMVFFRSYWLLFLIYGLDILFFFLILTSI